MCTYYLLLLNPSGKNRAVPQIWAVFVWELTPASTRTPVYKWFLKVRLVFLLLPQPWAYSRVSTDRSKCCQQLKVRLHCETSTPVKCAESSRGREKLVLNPGEDLLCCSTEGSLKVREARSEVHHQFKPSSKAQPTCASPAQRLTKSSRVRTLVSYCNSV